MDDREMAASDVSFGAWIQERRKALDLTQDELARRVGCSVSTIRKIERDERRPSRQIAELLAGELGLPSEQHELFLQVARAKVRVDRLSRPDFDAESGPQPPLANLPHPPTPLVGREPELEALVRMVDDPECRLLTLVGPGGIGKTRLAVEVAFRRQHFFADGTYFVPLASLSSTAFLVPAIADALGFAFQGSAEPRGQLLNYLSRKQSLLVPDNLEHLLAGADLFVEILERAPEVKLLATSRERLKLRGEWVVEVQGLPVPPIGQAVRLEEYSAFALFLQSARRAQGGFELRAEEQAAVARICQMVEGMPLGIELAAAWVPLLSCNEIAREIERGLDFLASSMRDVPQRQRSLRAVFEHSWNLLSADEQGAMRRLSVFRGEFSREAAQQVANATLPLLSALTSKSLVRRTEKGCYDLHPVMRQFTAEKLESSGEYDQLRTGHSRYYLERLHQREADVKGRRQVEALDEIARDLEEIRAAWEWAVEHRDEERIDYALESLFLFLSMRSRTYEGVELLGLAGERIVLDEANRAEGRILVRWSMLRSHLPSANQEIVADINRGLALARQHDDQLEIGLAFLTLGFYLTLVRGDFAGALSHFEQSLEAFLAADDPFYIARALHRVGYCQDRSQDPGEHARYTRQSLEVARASGNIYDMSWALHNLAGNALYSGDYQTAEEYLTESIDLSKATRDQVGLAISDAMLSLHHFLRGEKGEARALAARALALADDITNPISMAYALAVLGLCAVADGDCKRALQFSQKSLALRSNDPGVWLARWASAIARCGLADFDSAQRELHFLLKMTLENQWPAYMTWLLPVAAILRTHQGQERRAVELLALARTHPLSRNGWLDHWSLTVDLPAQIQAKISPEEYRRAWECGQGQDLEAVVTDLVTIFAAAEP